jgi:ribosomal protein L14E/L6E/L27E
LNAIFIFGVVIHQPQCSPPRDKGNTNMLEERTRTAGASVTKTTRRVKQERHIHNLDKWMTTQERKSFKNKNKNNFKDEILKTKHFKQNNLSECQ